MGAVVPRCDPYELSTRADVAALPVKPSAGPNVVAGDHPQLLAAEADRATWRLVELYSDSQLPFEVWLAWSGGTGQGPRVKVTVCRNARICVFARTLQVRVASLHGDPTTVNRVGCTVADGFAVTQNFWEYRDVGDGLTSAIEIPHYAARVRLDVEDKAVYAASELHLYSAEVAPVQRAEVPGDQQPDLGVPLAGANRLDVVVPAPNDFRVVFTLAI